MASFLVGIRTASKSIRLLLIFYNSLIQARALLSLSWYSLTSCLMPSDNCFHDLCCAITNLEAQYITHALFHHTTVITGMTESQQALMNHIIGQFRPPPFTHASFRGMWQMIVFKP